MSLKKFLKMTLMKKAQASLEYFIIFSAIVGLTLLSTSTFFTKAKETLLGKGDGNGTLVEKGFFQKAVDRLIK